MTPIATTSPRRASPSTDDAPAKAPEGHEPPAWTRNLAASLLRWTCRQLENAAQHDEAFGRLVLEGVLPTTPQAFNEVVTSCLHADEHAILGQFLAHATNAPTALHVNFFHHPVPPGHFAQPVSRDAMEILVKALLGHRHALTSLSFEACDVEPAMPVLCEALLSNTSLSELAFKSCGLEKSQVATLCSVLLDHPRLTRLTLRHNDLDDTDIQNLASLLEHNHLLQYLDLQDNSIGPGIEHIASAMAANQTLKHLDLSKCDLGPQAQRPIAQMLARNTRLTTLCLSENKLGHQGAGLDLIAGAMRSNATLSMLDVSKNDLNGAAITALTSGLESNTVLECLHLGDNVGNREAIHGLAAMLRRNTPLRMIHLDKSQLTSAHCAPLFDAMAHNHNLQWLDLMLNGLVDLPPGLERNMGLKTLMLADNPLSLSACHSIATVLKAQTSLQRLSLESCQINDDGASVLADALSGQARIQWLDLSDNAITPQGLQAIAGELLHNTSLRELDIHANGGDAAAAEMAALLKDALSVNFSLFKLNEFALSREPAGTWAAIDRRLAENMNHADPERRELRQRLTVQFFAKALHLPNLGILIWQDLEQSLAGIRAAWNLQRVGRNPVLQPAPAEPDEPAYSRAGEAKRLKL